ncbi:tetratricopeptide repeat protein [Aliikangiella marina]|uniref:Tetratricopeptide repeat protein n=1 Tax=Aliikangiella marina TaxID=1712262 RepID=A0A545TIA1_9GAMM|nr:tetratricopeptide repeat protein [Aliikangiella marina]TQV76938.1 tetratricopeptide repeat protein [Aliikangiella marina]
MMRMTIAFVTMFLIASCGSGGHRTLGDLNYKPKKEKEIEFEKMDYQQVREEYQELLTLFKDDVLKEQIERRIADVFMLEGGENQLKETEIKSYYAEAIKSYKEILKKYPNSPDNADVLYQLARAYEMDGYIQKELAMLEQLTNRHPQYKNNDEARFRMGEIYYSNGDYRKAQKEYEQVTTSKNESLLKYSYYMLGWAHYKQSRYESSISAFAEVLELLLNNLDEVEKAKKTEQSLITDTINSMSLALARSGGAQVLEQNNLLQGKAYLWLVYNSLGDYFLKKERYEDSADTFRRFVQKYNYSPRAPILHSKLISAYIKGAFPLQALNEKEAYVEFYGLKSQYAKNNGVNDNVKSQLKSYYDELASHYHSQAQAAEKQSSELAKSKPNIKRTKKRQDLQVKMLASFEKAARFYQLYIETFPADDKVPEFTYLQAEAYYSAGEFPAAIRLYEIAAYQLNHFKQDKYRVKAGYAAIISYQKLIGSLETQKQDTKVWQAQAVESMLKFAQIFHQDDRSPSVLTNAAEYLFSLEDYPRAREVAENLLQTNTQLAKPLKKTAYGISAHSSFKLGNLELAEESYFKQRSLTNKKSKEYQQITERMTSTMFRRSEALIDSGDKQSAITKLLKIKSVAPNSKLVVSAQYNAASLLIETAQWARAIKELKALKREQPKHKLAQEFDRKLAFAYEKNKSYKLAADAYLKLSKQDTDLKKRQDALFIAADLYEKNKDFDTAIQLFKQYARTYEQPFEVRMEARYRLAGLYETTQQTSKKLFWLRRIIDGDQKAGDQRNDRSRWLAAWANSQYGDSFADEFNKLKLTSNLEKSLPKKNKALSSAIKRYEMAADYGVLEFVTMSSHKMAGLYERFAKELRQVKLPKNLSQDEVGLYRKVLEEQATPFIELAVELHMGNLERAWDGDYNQWIEKSFLAMKALVPERFNKREMEVAYGDEIR